MRAPAQALGVLAAVLTDTSFFTNLDISSAMKTTTFFRQDSFSARRQARSI